MLETKASELERYAEERLIDPDGVVYTNINDSTGKPFAEGDLAPEDDWIPVEDYSPPEILGYENAGMTTGAYLAAQASRFRATGDPMALARARRTFAGIRHIYDLGRELEEGFFPKPYGGRFTEQTSTDQYLYAMKGMAIYLGVAPEDDAKAVRTMIARMVDFWVKRGYHYSYYNIPDMLWPLGRFPSLLLLAHAVSGDRKYHDEFVRLNEAEEVYLRPSDSPLDRRLARPDALSEYEVRHGRRFLLSHLGECAAMSIMQLDECLQRSGRYREHWLNSMRQAWREGQLQNADRGLALRSVLYDPGTGEVEAPPPGYVSDGPAPHDWDFLRWIGGILVPRSTMLARVGVNVCRWLPEEHAAGTVVEILSELAIEDMHSTYIDPDGAQLLPQHRFMSRAVCGDAITNWLWAYWQGRAEGVIQPG